MQGKLVLDDLTMVKDALFSEKALRRFTENIFKAIGCSESDAVLAADVLIKADLRGIDSHGVARLSGYVRLQEAGRINTKPTFRIISERASVATMDADAAMGLVSGPAAMKIAIDKAKETGTGMVAVQNSNHFGIGAYHAILAAEVGMIGICMTNASPLVAPTLGKKRMLGTNPLTFVVPAGKYPPFVADLATSAAANGKLELLQRKKNPAPEGWLQSAEGQPETDPHALKAGGALVGLGSTADGGMHKGYCLGATVDIFSGVLSGANYGPWVPPFVAFLPLAAQPVGLGIGHFFCAMDVGAFRPALEFLEHMDTWIEAFKQSDPIDPKEPVLIPGEPEHVSENQRMVEGIPVLGPVVEDMTMLSEKLGVPMPEGMG